MKPFLPSKGQIDPVPVDDDLFVLMQAYSQLSTYSEVSLAGSDAGVLGVGGLGFSCVAVVVVLFL